MLKQKKQKSKIIWTGFFLRIFFLLLFFGLFYGGFFLYNLNKNITKSLSSDNTSSKTNALISIGKSTIVKKTTKLKGEEDGRINILLLGVGGEGHKGKYLTDTIVLVSINPKTYQSAILSIPRDLYVKIPNSNYHTKINALYTYGLRNKNLSKEESIKLLLETVENITAQKIPYYAILDFDGFKKVINIIDGLNINVENDIYDSHYPGPNYSYETFEIKKGFHHLDAETALKYARVRHTKGGDFGRAHRQQQIIARAREKAMSLKILANPVKVIQLLNTLGDHFRTNITSAEIPRFISLLKNVNIQQATMKVLDAWSKDSLLRSTHIPLGGVSAYVLIPKNKGYSEIQALSKNIFNLSKLSELKEKIKEENASIKVLALKQSTLLDFKKILLGWGYKKITTSNKKNIYKKYCSAKQDRIISHNDREKIFTLNDLAGKLDLNVDYIPYSDLGLIQNKSLPNITICTTEKMAKYFKKDNGRHIKDFQLNREIIDENGKVLINQ